MKLLTVVDPAGVEYRVNPVAVCYLAPAGGDRVRFVFGSAGQGGFHDILGVGWSLDTAAKALSVAQGAA
ncbi:MAG TPA: hypothetical protein VGF33_03105 [Caulobacteraceae bacterium]|jgi:hypothetical protein